MINFPAPPRARRFARNTAIRYGGVFLVLALVLAIFSWQPQLVNAVTNLTAPNPVTAAWEKARAMESYHFTSDVTQVTIPVATVTNVGRSNRNEYYHLQGESDLRNQTLALTLWANGGSVLDSASGIDIKVADGKSWLRTGNGEWQEREGGIDTFAPGGDFMGYLNAVKQVQTHEPENRNGIHFTRYTFQIDGPRFAIYARETLEAAMRSRGELPPGLNLETSTYYRDMLGEGELWVDENGLPLRQILTLRFPEQKEQQIHTQITTDFSQYGTLNSATQAAQPGAQIGAALQNSTPTTAILVAGLALLFMVMRYGRSRKLYNGLALVVIFSLVIGPLLTTYTNVQFWDTQTAKAAAQEEQQAAVDAQREVREALGTVEFNPHLNPMESGDQRLEIGDSTYEAGLQAPVSSLQTAPALQTSDDGTDTDGDGLTDFAEERIGTNLTDADTDADSVNDKAEVMGFSFGGQTWYLNPNASDSNNDGLSDGLEWGFNETTGQLLATPRDTDADGFPDLFDPDNDGDGVPDHKDSAPFAKSAVVYGETTPLQLTLNNLTPDKPTFVEFQLRPQNEKHLWFAFNLLDWPQDSAGQVQDIDGKTYADLALSQGRTPDINEANGDMKLIPMLEIRIPTDSANLPSIDELIPYNITLNDYTADGSVKIAYVPLNIVTDERTGERVAFSGQMRYLPTGIWNHAHSIRLAWVVQALVDQPCDRSVDTSADCQADGYLNNVPTLLQSYYTNWTLTGLGVREEHGVDMAIVYEDPAIDDNLQDDPAIWGLAFVLDGHFTNPRQANNQRTLTLADLPTRFDRDNAPSPEQRFDVPNLLQVESQTYSTLEQAAASTTMTATTQILDTQFRALVSNNRAIKPLLLFAQETRLRILGLDMSTTTGNYVSQSGASLTLDMAPSGQAAQTVSVDAMVKWQAFCAPATGDVSFSPCSDEDYWDILEARYSGLASLPSDPDPEWMGARITFAQIYYVSLRAGYIAPVQDGTQVISSRYSLESESDTATAVRASLLGLATVPFLAAQNIMRLFPAYFPGLTSAQPYLFDYGKNLRNELKILKLARANELAEWGEVDGRIDEQITGVKRFLQRYHLQKVGAAASVLLVIGQIATLWPGLSDSTRTAIGSVTIVLSFGVTIVLPALTTAVTKFNAPVNTAVKELFKYNFKISTVAKVFGVIGAVVSVALIWGFFIYGAATSGLSPSSPQFIKSAVEAAVATVITILLFILAINPIGAIISAIIALVDLILNLVCELGHDNLREVPGLGGACFTLTTAVTKVLTSLLYNYDLMIDFGRDDLMTTGAPSIALANPSKGLVAGNAITLSLPVTTTIYHLGPNSDGAGGPLIVYYPYLFSADNLKSSTFSYKLFDPNTETGAQAVDLGQMTSAWQGVTTYDSVLSVPLYYGQAASPPAPRGNVTVAAGINRSLPVKLAMNFAVPAYECFSLLIIPVCYTKEYEGSNSDIPLDSIRYDILPATLDEFLALGAKPDGGLGQSWDPQIGSLRDADGDGLLSSLYNGLDPNDNSWDSDGDSLSDAVELGLRAAGKAVSPILWDTDNDGLSDLQEIMLGTNPALADTDNDGLLDGQEVRHLVYNANGPTNVWAGGWQVRVNASSPFDVWVSSSPFSADIDRDGIDDLSERALAGQVDARNQPYHPRIYNVSPLTVLADSNDLDGYVAPTQALLYTTTVIATQPVAPGVLNITAPSTVSGTDTPFELLFNPMSSSIQTVTQATNLQLLNAVAGNLVLSSTVTTRLPGSGEPWAWTPATSETGLSFGAGRTGTFINGAAARPDRQDSYRLLGQTVTAPNEFSSPGDLLAFTIPGGSVRNLEVNPATPAQRANSSPAISCNDQSVCLAVWSEQHTIASFRIGAALLAADGTVIKSFAATAPPSSGTNEGNWYDSVPVVASDGVNFLVAWQRLFVYQRSLSDIRTTYAFRTELMTRLYDGTGNPLTAETLLTNERREFYSDASDTTGALLRASSTLNRLDLDWVGDRYRLTHGISLGNAGNEQNLPDLQFEENGVGGGTIKFRLKHLTWRDINASGALIAGSKATVYNDASNDDNASHSLVYNPNTKQLLLIQTRLGSVYYQQFLDLTDTSSGLTYISAGARNAVATYHAPSRGYLIGWTDTVSGAFRYQALDGYFLTLLGGDQQQLTWPVTVDATRTTLTCPATTSAPVIDLRFEELPGATSFGNHLDLLRPASCSGDGCPTAGMPGATAAPNSDYAVRFDGVNDGLTVDTGVDDSFTIAFWLKAPSNSTSIIFDHGSLQSTGWAMTVSNGLVSLWIRDDVGGSIVLHGLGTVINENTWHFVVATRNGVTGQVAIYVDGVETESITDSTPTSLDPLPRVYIGSNSAGANRFRGQLDHLQLYPAAMSATTVQALYERSLQSYCIAAAVPTTETAFRWSRLSLNAQDTRGGRIRASGGLTLQVDAGKPIASITSVVNNEILAAGQVIGGTASDALSGVNRVEIRLNNGAWQPANGANTWSFSLAGLSGDVDVQARAVDNVGNVGDPSPTVRVRIDTVAPTLTIDATPTPIKPAKSAGGQWQVTLSGDVNDNLPSNLNPNSLFVKLEQQSGVGVAQTQQQATISGNRWTINYLLDPNLYDPTGVYTVTAQVDDNVALRGFAIGTVRLDAAGPIAALHPSDVTRTAITQTVTIGGLVTDTNSIAGIDKLEIAFTPVEQVASLPRDITSAEAETLLNRTWTPVTVTNRGTGVATTTWSYQIPAGMENIYQIDLRGTDMLGNVAISANLWRGPIDTLAPRLVMTAQATGVTHRDPASGELRYQMHFVCAAQDRNLVEGAFTCPGQGLAEPVRSFDDTSALANLFPDLALRTGLAISYTLWSSTPALEATVSACDSFGHCANLSNTATAGTVTPSSEPRAVVVSPTDGAFVAASGVALQVTVAAEAAAFLQTLRLRLDGSEVGSVSFAQTAAVEIVQQTFSIPHPSVGTHTLVAEATDWNGVTQTTLFPVAFTLDGAAPQVAINTVEVSAAETWALGSGILQFTGTASDDIGLAAVQVKVGDGPWSDAAFNNGNWHIAYPVPDPEGQTLTVFVRAIDLAGQLSEVERAVPVNFSIPIPPDTTLITTPPNPSAGPNATFVFTGTAGTNGLAAFECRLNAGLYQPCATPWTINELSQGAQTFSVRAIDSQGYNDPTPATYSWTVTAGALAVAITAAPSNPTTERTASFSFVASGVTGYECKLTQATFGADTASFTSCVSGISYADLTNGEYTFEVRAHNAEQMGQATRHTWHVVNEAPVAHDQQLITLQPEPIDLTLSAQDVDPLTFRVVQPPAHGTLLGSTPDLTYVPDTDFFGADSFTFQADDGQARSNLAAITIQVEERGNPIGQCSDYTIYQRSNNSYAAYTRIDGALVPWSGNILVGTELQDNLTGNDGKDLILGLGGNDILNGKAGDDIICGGEGNDLIYGELGTDYLDGGNHNDVLNGGTGDFDVLLGGEGSDTLLDPDGVAELQGGPGSEQINLSLRNGWRTPDGQTEFLLRFAAGLGNDTVTFGILGTDTFLVDITGDEWTDQAGEGTADTIRFAGRIDQDNSSFRKFEGQVIVATSELPLITDETGYEYWVDEPVEESPNEEEPTEEEPTPQPPITGQLNHQLYLPVIGK